MRIAKEKPARDCGPAGFKNTDYCSNINQCLKNRQGLIGRTWTKIRFDLSAALAGFAIGLLASVVAAAAVVIAVAAVKGLLP